MTGPVFDMGDVTRLAAVQAAAGIRVGAKMAAVVRKSAAEVEAAAKAGAPVDTGNLRNSISTEIEGDGRFGVMEATVSPHTDYAAFVEFGTSRPGGHAQPYMGPALDRAAPGFYEAAQQAGYEAI